MESSFAGLFTAHDPARGTGFGGLQNYHGPVRVGSRRIGSDWIGLGRIGPRAFQNCTGAGQVTPTLHPPDPTQPDAMREV